MTRDQAINFLRSSGLSQEQIDEVVDALCPYKQVKIATDLGITYDGLLDKTKMLVFTYFLSYEAIRSLNWTVKEEEE